MQVTFQSGSMPPNQSFLKSASKNKVLCLLNLRNNPPAIKCLTTDSIQREILPLGSFPLARKILTQNFYSTFSKTSPVFSSPKTSLFGSGSQKNALISLNKIGNGTQPRVSGVFFLHSNSDNSKKPSRSQNVHRAWLPHSSGFSLLKKGFAFHFYNFSTSLPQVNDLYVRALHDAKFTEAFPPENSDVVSEVSKETKEGIESEKEITSSVSSLRLNSGACSFPHPAKIEKGGEDAYFISPEDNAVGVADGVGGWADMGVDAGLYARELMMRSSNALAEEPKGDINPARVLTAAHSRTKSQGSSTACILVLSDDKLQAANLGDSGFMVIRNGRLLFKSPSQQHDFNFPYQLGSEGCDSPDAAEVFLLPVAAGDILVAGTDGLFDNVFDNELTSIVMHSVKAGFNPQGTAEKIAALARIRAQDRARVSPFSKAAQEAGWLFIGGKLDDITVVVSYITPC